MTERIIALDVGGTSIKAGVCTADLDILPETVASYPSHAREDAETIMRTLALVIRDQWQQMPGEDNRLAGIGFGFPGPFDYHKGVSLMNDNVKFDSIYGLPLGELLTRWALDDEEIRTLPGFSLRFENDATVFAYGEYEKGKGRPFRRLACVTLGTGCGSTFLRDGQMVRGEDGIPADGMIYHRPYLDGTIDDAISKRGIQRLAVQFGFPPGSSVREMDVAARNGDQNAAALFDAFGKRLGDALAPYLESFDADGLVLGGNIAKGFPLFEAGMRETIGHRDLPILVSDNLEKSALIGAASLIVRAG